MRIDKHEDVKMAGTKGEISKNMDQLLEKHIQKELVPLIKEYMVVKCH